MKILMLPLSGGLIIGLFLSSIFWDYQGPTYKIINRAGVYQTIYEWDFDFVYKSSLLACYTDNSIDLFDVDLS